MASASLEGAVRGLGVRAAREIDDAIEIHTGIGSIAAVSPDATTLATLGRGGGVRLWSPRRMGVATTLDAPSGQIGDVAFAPRGAAVVSGDNGGRIRFWNARTGAALGPALAAGDTGASGVAVSADGSTLLAALGDGSVRPWRLPARTSLELRLT